MKKLFKVLLWLAGIFVLLVVLAVIGLKLFFPKEKVRQMAVERGSEALGRPLSVADLDLSIWGGLGVELVDVEIESPIEITEESFLRADNIDLKLQLWPLLSSEFRVNRLIINKPRIVMVKTASGTTNFDFQMADPSAPPAVAQAPAEAKAAAAAVSFEALEINEGEIIYRDDSSGLAARVDNLNLATSLENPSEGVYESRGKISLDSLEVSFDEPYPTVSLALSYRARLDLNKKHLSLPEAELDVNGLQFNLTAEVSGAADTWTARGNVKSDRITVADLFGLLPPGQQAEMADFDIEGDFSVDVDLEYDGGRVDDPVTYAGTAVISDMALSKKGIDGELKFRRAVVDFKPDNLRFNVEDGTFDDQPFKGQLTVDDFEDPVVNGELAGSVNLAFVQPFLPPDAGHELAGRADFDLKFSGKTSDVKNMEFSGNLGIADGMYNSRLLPEPVESFAIDAYFDNTLVNVRKFEGRFASGYLNFNGRINNLVGYMMADSVEAQKISPSVDGAMNGELDLGMVNQFLPEQGSPQLTGRMAMDMKFAGSAAKAANFQPRGKVSISDASYTDSLLPEPITEFRAEMTVSPDTIGVTEMYAKFVSSDVTFSGDLAHPFPYLLPLKDLDRSQVRKPLFVFRLSSHRFDSDKLFPEAVPGSGESRAVTPVDSVSLIILPDIDGRGTFQVDTLIYSQVEFTSIEGKIRIEDRKIECYDVNGAAYTGSVSGKTTIDLNDFENPVYTGEFSASQIEANDFMSRFTKFGGHLYGKCNMTGSYNARGWEPDQFLNSLNMNGNGKVQDGRIVTSGALLHKLLSDLSQQVGESFDKEQPVKNLNSDIEVKDGRIKVDNLKTKLGNIGDIELIGFYGFDGGLDYNGTMLLTKEMSSKLASKGGILGGLAGFLTNKSSERISLPLVISGTVDSPQFAIDWSALTKDAGKDVQKKAGDALKDLFKK